MTDHITKAPDTRVDYAAIVHPESLKPVRTLSAPAIAAVAVYVGTTRLIDNAMLSPKG